MQAVEYAWAIGGTASAGFTASGCGFGGVAGGDVDAGDEGPVLGDVDVDVGGHVDARRTTGSRAGTFPLGPFEFAAPTVPYPVSEYRGRLTSPGGEGT